MTLQTVLILLAGVCGVLCLMDRERPWAGAGILLLAVALVI